jgi:hypothetical protein
MTHLTMVAETYTTWGGLIEVFIYSASADKGQYKIKNELDAL